MRRCILNYLGVNCQNVSKLTSNVLKTEMYLYVYVCLCAYMFIYMYVFIEKKQTWEMVSAEGHMIFIVLFLQLFCRFEYSHNKKLWICVGFGVGRDYSPPYLVNKDVSKSPFTDFSPCDYISSFIYLKKNFIYSKVPLFSIFRVWCFSYW